MIEELLEAGLDQRQALLHRGRRAAAARRPQAPASAAPAQRPRGAQPLLDPLGRGDVLAHAELLRLEAEREADELRQVQDREAEVAVDDLGRLGLLHVEVEVAERAGGDQAVGAGVERVADVGAGLPQRGLAVHRDDREAAALAGAVVLDDLAAERLDHLLEVEVAVGVLVVAEPVLRAERRSSRRRGRPGGPPSGRCDLLRRARRARSPRPAPRGSSCW